MTKRKINDDYKITGIEEEIDSDETAQYRIITYGADYTLSVYYEKLRRGDIKTPSFQRGYVWDANMASKLIESFLLGLPIPQIFLFKEEKENYLLVVDGKQRLETIKYFFDGKFPTGSKFYLRGVKQKWNKKTYKTLDGTDRRKFEDSVLRATIFEQTDPNDNSSIFEIFERLNTGGMNLTDQEIRNCMINKRINEFLKELNEYSNWRKLFGRKTPHPRMRDVEMVLRFIALYENGESYSKPMKRFLTGYMHEMESFSESELDRLRLIFTKTIDYILENLGKNAFKLKKGLNAAVYDAVMVGVARTDQPNLPDLKSRYNKLIRDLDFIDYVSVHTTDNERVYGRIAKAIEAFSL